VSESRTTPPGRHVALYDGDCGMCRASVAKLRGLAPSDAVDFRDFHGDGVLDAFPAITREACMEAMQLVLPDGRVVHGAEAVARVLATRRIVGAVAWLYYVPVLRPLLDVVYVWIARRRYRISVRAGLCQDGVCHLP